MTKNGWIGDGMIGSFLNSIRVRMIVAVIIMISIPFAVLQITNVLLIYGKLQKKTVYTTQALSRSIATNVSEFMTGTYSAAQLLSVNERVIKGDLSGRKLLTDSVKNMPYFRLFYVQRRDGMQTIRSSGELSNRSDRWWFKKLVADPQGFVSDAYISVNNNELVTSIFLPMSLNGNLQGILGADFTLSTIQSAVGLYSNKDISYIVMDSKGSVLTSSDYRPGEYINYIDYTKRTVLTDKNNHYILDKDGQIMTKVEKIEVSGTMKKIISNALEKKTQYYQFRDRKNNILVCAYQPIKLPGKSDPWSVIVFQKQADYETMATLVAMFLLLITFCIFITFRLINKNVLSPVLKIQQDMARIAEGELDVKIDMPPSNELGELAGDINKMVESLKIHQQRLDEDEKMASLGSLVAGVAHEINTPLGIGVTTSSYMQKVNDDSRRALSEGRFSKKDLVNYMETMDDSLELLQFNLERGSRIIQSFKRIAVDQSSEEKEEFNVLQYINGVVLSLVHEYKRSNHTIEVLCDEDLVLYSYPGVFAQILTNFIINSVTHAFSGIENGKMTISACMERQTGHFILIYSDNGCGISEEHKQNLFKPFFTTSRKLGGSGLGLSVVHSLVTKKLGGEIAVEEREGNGLSFRITIPN